MKTSSVGILGSNYSGSTLFCEFLSGISNSFNVGESHWIFDREDYNLCMECKTNPCPRFSKSSIDTIRKSSGSIVDRLKAEFGDKIFIFSDKNPNYYRKSYYDGCKDISCFIFIHKGIRQQIFSNCRRMNGGFSYINMEKSLYKYHKDILKIDKFLSSIDKKVLKVDMEFLHKRANSVAELISKELGVSFVKDFDLLRSPMRENSHYIGGNNSLVRQKKGSDDFFKGEISHDCRYLKFEDIIEEVVLKNKSISSEINNIILNIGEG